MSSTPPPVPFIRTLDQGSAGRDVIAVKRALARAGYIQWPDGGKFTPIWGPFAAISLKRFEKAKGLKQTGVYTYVRHEHLRRSRRKNSRTEWAFDDYAISIMVGEDLTPWERTAQKVVDACDQAILKRDQIRYSMARPHPDISPYPNLPYATDCSGFVTWALRSGGSHVPDPNGKVGGTYWRYGFTGTLWANNAKVPSLSQARVCDFVFYGVPWLAGASAHVAIVRRVEGGKVYVASMGSDLGPLNLPADYRVIVGIRRPSLGV